MWKEIRPDILIDQQELEKQSLNWIEKNLANGKLIGFIAKTEDGKVAGSGCIWLREQPPVPMHSRLEVPYLMSMYTETAFRGRGVGRSIVEVAIDWCRSHGYDRINLDASEAGKPLYERLGFKAGYSMRLQL